MIERKTEKIKSRAMQKASGLYLFGTVLKQEFNKQAAFQIPARHGSQCEQ